MKWLADCEDCYLFRHKQKLGRFNFSKVLNFRKVFYKYRKFYKYCKMNQKLKVPYQYPKISNIYQYLLILRFYH